MSLFSVHLTQPSVAKDIENFYIESVVENNIPRGSFIKIAPSSTTILRNNNDVDDDETKEERANILIQNQKILSNPFFRNTHFINNDPNINLDDVEWITPARRKEFPGSDSEARDYDSVELNMRSRNKLEHQLENLQKHQKLEPEEQTTTTKHHRENQEQENDNAIIQRKVRQLQDEEYNKTEKEKDMLHPLQTDDTEVLKVDNDDCDGNNNNNNNDDDDKRINTWRQLSTFSAGSSVYKNWSLTLQQLPLTYQVDESDDFSEQDNDNIDDNTITVYFR